MYRGYSEQDERNSLVTKRNSRIVGFFNSLDKMLDRLERMHKESRPMLNGERFLTDSELSERLKLSRKALYEYRVEGRIPYCHIGGKILYRESDVEKMLENHYRKAYK